MWDYRKLLAPKTKVHNEYLPPLSLSFQNSIQKQIKKSLDKEQQNQFEKLLNKFSEMEIERPKKSDIMGLMRNFKAKVAPSELTRPESSNYRNLSEQFLLKENQKKYT